jgi:NTP pyrophosphatase (non-canonical NTP hydrolase)
MQGYKENEYEVLEQSEDIDYISDREIELQKSYGYKVDRKLYKHLFNKMKINATEQTSTFPCPVNKLKGQLMDNIGLKWKTTFGQFEITKESVNWIMANVKESMYNSKRSYVYNKAFYEAFVNKLHNPKLKYKTSVDKVPNRFDLIRDWAEERGIYDKGDIKTQCLKLMEEVGETCSSILDGSYDGTVDGIGDCVVVLTSLAHLQGVTIEQCIDAAYNEIKDRKGKMVDGTYIREKDED